MKKINIAIMILLFLSGQAYAGEGLSAWEKLGAGTIAADDMFPITDVSDTTQSAEGSSKTATAAQVKAYVLSDLEAADSVSFAGVQATGAGGLKAGTENSVRGAITLYSNVNPYAVGINSAATPTGTYTITLPAGAPGGSNYLWNMDADGTSDWTAPSTFATPTGSAADMTVVSSGFDGNLSTTDNTLQEIAQKFDDFTAAGTGDMVLNATQSVTGAKTFDKDMLKTKGTSTGVTTISTANTSATSYTATLQAATGTLAYTADIPDETVYLSDCSGITNGFCVDTDNDNLYYYDGDAVVGIFAAGADGEWGVSLKNNTTTFAPASGYDSGFTVIGNNPYTYYSSGTHRLQLWDTDLDTWATVTPSANGQSLVAAANYAAMRTLLDLEAGTDFNAYGTIVSGSSPTVDAAGEIAIDTTSDQIKFYGTAAQVIPSVQFVSFVIPGPVATDDINIMKAPYGMTLTAVSCIVQGTTSVTGQLQECDSAGANCADTDSDITCDADGAADDGALSNGSIDSADWIQWKTTSISGTPTFLTVTAKYTVVGD